MRPLRVLGHANGPRVYFLDLRVHHGAAGAVAALLGVLRRDPRLVVVGAALAAHDRADWRVWLRVERLP